jgi:serine/threonine-protein kinase
VPLSSDNLTAVAEADRRHARLAVAWFAIDADKVDDVLRAVLERRERGETVDFLYALTEADVLSQPQAERLRLEQPPDDLVDNDEDSSERRRTKLDKLNGDDPRQMGPYHILRRLGVGGMGAVYLGFDGNDNRQVAIKVLSAEHAPKQNILQRFHREGRNGSLLNHPNIVRTCDVGLDAASGLNFIVLEFVDGPSAQDLLEKSGKLKVGDAVHVILDIARALEHAHKNLVVHRDIKPGNILLTPSGIAKLCDLGLAKRRDDPTSITHADQGIGTPYYMPYEQAMNAKMADERSDIYALGATLYHLVTGDVPFPGESALEIVERKGTGVFAPASTRNPDVPATLDDILARMLARDPSDRYQSISETIVDLERAQLAVDIPSFVEREAALKDPIVVERLNSHVETTQPDLDLKKALEEKGRQIWFLIYQDRRGNPCKAKGSQNEIIARLGKGTIPPTAQASRTPTGTYKPIGDWPEFQAAVAKAQSPAPNIALDSREFNVLWLWIAAGVVAIGIVVILIAAILYAIF